MIVLFFVFCIYLFMHSFLVPHVSGLKLACGGLILCLISIRFHSADHSFHPTVMTIILNHGALHCTAQHSTARTSSLTNCEQCNISRTQKTKFNPASFSGNYKWTSKTLLNFFSFFLYALFSCAWLLALPGQQLRLVYTS